MATQIQFRRGTATQHNVFTGATAEVTVNTTNKSVHVHDGTTQGGFELARADLSNTSGLSLAGLTTASSLNISNNFYVSGISTFVGAVTFQGGTITLGDANTDNIVFTADVNSSIIPNTDNLYDLGSLSQQWRNLYVNGLSDLTDIYASGISTFAGITTVTGATFFAKQLNVSGVSTFTGLIDSNGGLDVTGHTELDNVSSSGIITAIGGFVGNLTGTASTATKLETPRTFEITGDILASAISFDGGSNVSLAATIQPNSVALGTDTTGDYVQSILGTSNQIIVTSGTGESSTPTLSIPSQFTAPQDVEITRDLQVNRNLNVNGSITIGGTSATLFTTDLKIYDPDIILGFRTDAFGNDVSTDNTANHGGIAIASTEGNPLVQLFIAGIETTPATYKKFMWFKSGEFAGLGTDAWLSNYAIGIGSTQFPSGTRLAAGNVQFTQDNLAVVGNINASGIVTAPSLRGTNVNLSGVCTASDFNSTSDINLKENIRTIQNSTEIISELEGVRFVWKADGKESIGVIAQEVEKTLPELVSNGDIKTVNYNGLIGVLIEAVKDQQKQIDQLKIEIENLKK